MPFNVQHEAMVKSLKGKQAQSSLRTSGRKAPGTRLGAIDDWREGFNEQGKISARYGHALRDGR